MAFQIIFSGENKKNITNVSSAEFSQRLAKVLSSERKIPYLPQIIRSIKEN